MKKEALLIFSKPPIPGLVKTRLTTKHGGFLSEEQAAEFFRRSLFDVAEMCQLELLRMQAQNDAAVAVDAEVEPIQYGFFISTTPASNVEVMRKTFEDLGQWPMEIHYIHDSGKTFDDHFDDSFKQIFDLGYDCIVSVGGDLPTMPASHISQAFSWLEYFDRLGTPGFVQAPCQECGTSLVGFSHDTPIDHQNIYYNLDGVPALDGYVKKLEAANIPSAYLSPVSDVDIREDLAHMISCLRAIKAAAAYQPDLYVAQRVLDWVDWVGIRVGTPPNENHDPRQYIDE
jgi:glycosyltransferase A (GT-A) superfamily protein (DUF2064 family)